MDTGTIRAERTAVRASWPARRLVPAARHRDYGRKPGWRARSGVRASKARPPGRCLDDLWGTLIAAQRLAHLNLAGLYTLPTQLVSLPGARPIILSRPLASHRPGRAPADGSATLMARIPACGLLAGPYQVAISAVVLFAADAIAATPGRDQAPSASGWPPPAPTALWSVTSGGGTRKDALAVGLLVCTRSWRWPTRGRPLGLAGRGGGGRSYPSCCSRSRCWPPWSSPGRLPAMSPAPSPPGALLLAAPRPWPLDGDRSRRH